MRSVMKSVPGIVSISEQVCQLMAPYCNQLFSFEPRSDALCRCVRHRPALTVSKAA